MDVVRYAWTLFPRALRAQLSCRGDRVLFALGEDTEEVSIANYGDIFQVRNTDELGKICIWPHYPPMQHPRKDHVLHVTRPTGELALGDQAAARWCRRCSIRPMASPARHPDIGVELQIPVRRRTAPFAQRAQLGAGLAQRRRHPGWRGCPRSRLRRDCTQCSRAACGSSPAGRRALRRRSEAVRMPWPRLDLAARDRYRAVALEMHALRQAPRVRQRRRLSSEHRGSHAPRGCASRSGRDSCPERSGFSLPRAIFRSRGARRRSSRCRSCSNRTARPGGARAPFAPDARRSDPQLSLFFC